MFLTICKYFSSFAWISIFSSFVRKRNTAYACLRLTYLTLIFFSEILDNKIQVIEENAFLRINTRHL